MDTRSRRFFTRCLPLLLAATGVAATTACQPREGVAVESGSPLGAAATTATEAPPASAVSLQPVGPAATPAEAVAVTTTQPEAPTATPAAAATAPAAPTATPAEAVAVTAAQPAGPPQLAPLRHHLLILRGLLDADDLQEQARLDPALIPLADAVARLETHIDSLLITISSPMTLADYTLALQQLRHGLAEWHVVARELRPQWQRVVAEWEAQWELTAGEWRAAWANATDEWSASWQQATTDWEAAWAPAAADWEQGWADAAEQWEQGWADAAEQWEQGWADAAERWRAGHGADG